MDIVKEPFGNAQEVETIEETLPVNTEEAEQTEETLAVSVEKKVSEDLMICDTIATSDKK